MPPITSTATARQELSFPLLREEEVLQLLAELQFPMSQKDLAEANVDLIREIYATFCAESCELLSVEELISERSESIGTCFRVSHQENHGISLSLITLYSQLKQVFTACRVPDFELSDIVQPTKKRFILLFSALTNFLRFKSMLSDFVTAQVEKYSDGRAMSAVFRENLESKRAELAEIQENYAIIKPTLEGIDQSYKAKSTDMKVQSKEFEQIEEQIQTSRNEFGKKERECSNLQREIQLIQDEIAQIQLKIISPDAPERLRKQSAQFEADILNNEKRIQDFEQYIRDVQEKALSQQEVDQTLNSLATVFEKSEQDRMELQDVQESLEAAAFAVEQLEDEEEEIAQFQKQCAEQLLRVHVDEEQFMRDLKGENTESDILKYSREIAELHERNIQIETNIEILSEQNDAVIRERNQIKADLFKKQEALVDELNLFIKGYCIEMQEMNQLFEE